MPEVKNFTEDMKMPTAEEIGKMLFGNKEGIGKAIQENSKSSDILEKGKIQISSSNDSSNLVNTTDGGYAIDGGKNTVYLKNNGNGTFSNPETGEVIQTNTNGQPIIEGGNNSRGDVSIKGKKKIDLSNRNFS